MTRAIARNLAITVVVALVALFALAQCGTLGVREWAYVRANNAYLDQIELHPASVEVSRETTGYSGADSAILYLRPEGWQTQVILEAPDGTTEADLRAFYEPQFAAGWRQHGLVVGVAGATMDAQGCPAALDPPPLVITSYCRDGGRVSFDYDRLRALGEYVITVDHGRSDC